MASTTDPIVAQIQQEFHGLLAYVTGPAARSQTAYTVELTLFRTLLTVGGLLLRLFFVQRAAERPPEPVLTAEGVPLRYHDQRETPYYSIFGKLRFARHYFTAVGQPGCCPLDAALSLPERCYSDLLREWGAYDTTDAAYRETQTTLERILGRKLSIEALETSVLAAAQDVPAFLEQPAMLAAGQQEGPILVVQADGKGVPMVQPRSADAPLRLGKGQKRTKKKEAVVTSLYTIAPYVRTPQEVVAALLQDRDGLAPAPRPKPVGKEVRATLQGKEVALTRMAQRAAQREGAHIRARVALTDGATALQQQLETHCPTHTLVLDVIHATEYLWDSATALLGETHPGRTAWVRSHLEALLAGQTAEVIASLDEAAAAPTCTATQRDVVQGAADYYRHNAPHMHYAVYLACGWPIGTGVVEGACGHLVKDRMEHGGMRWTAHGAQAVLDLRAIRLNAQWEAYWCFHRQQQHLRLYGASAVLPVTAEEQALADAA